MPIPSVLASPQTTLEIPEAFNNLGGNLDSVVPVLALVLGVAVTVAVFVLAGKNRNLKAASFLIGIAVVLLSLPVFSAANEDHYEVSGMVVNSIPNSDGAVISLDTTGREMIQLNNGPLPYISDSVLLDCTLTETGTSRMFDCSLVELRESSEQWMH